MPADERESAYELFRRGPRSWPTATSRSLCDPGRCLALERASIREALARAYSTRYHARAADTFQSTGRRSACPLRPFRARPSRARPRRRCRGRRHLRTAVFLKPGAKLGRASGGWKRPDPLGPPLRSPRAAAAGQAPPPRRAPGLGAAPLSLVRASAAFCTMHALHIRVDDIGMHVCTREIAGVLLINGNALDGAHDVAPARSRNLRGRARPVPGRQHRARPGPEVFGGEVMPEISAGRRSRRLS